jgi:putative aldouronate transport system permease protein
MRYSLGSRVFDVVNYIIMILLVIVMAYPLMNVLAISLSDPDHIALGNVGWYPKGFNIKGYEVIMEKSQLYISYKNTIVYAFVGTLFTLVMTSLMAYPLSIPNFKPKKFITVFLAVTMFFSGGLIPTYMVIRELHMLNTLWVMVIPGCVGAFNVFIYRSFFQNIPSELRESALMDGANDITILFRIYMPLSKALLSTFALFSIVAFWNEWFSALLYLKDESRYPLQMFLRSLIVESSGGASEEIQRLVVGNAVNPKNIQMAAIVVTLVPILCIYPFVQKYFVKGALVGSVKG